MVRNVLTVLAAALVAFVVVPLFITSQSPTDIDSIDVPAMVLYGSLIAAASTVLSGILLGLLQALRLERFTGAFALFLLTWAVAAGFFLPVCASVGMVDAESVPTNPLHLAATAIISAGAAMLTSAALRRLLTRFLVFGSIGALAIALVSISQVPRATAAAGDRDPLNLSRSRNIVVLSFDGLSGPMVAKLMGSDARLRDAFKDFTLFENAVSQGPATETSLMADLYGVQDYKTFGGTQAEVERALDRRFGESIPARQVDDSYAYGYSHNLTRRLDLNAPAYGVELEYLRRQKAFDVLRYASARLATSHVLVDAGWGSVLDALNARLVPTPNVPLAWQLERVVGPPWDRLSPATIKSYDYWIDNLALSDKAISVRYLHFTFTHFPVDFDERCVFRSHDAQWHRAHQNEQGERAETICALEKFARFLRRLQELGIYDHSLVVLKSDHGEAPYYFDSYPDNLVLNGHRYIGYNRYRPLLMIKDFRARHPETIHEPSLVLLGDLARTVCAHSGLDADCEQFHGADLLSDDLGDFDEPYFLYVPGSAESSHHFESLLSVRVPSRRLPLLKALEESGVIVIGNPAGGPSVPDG